MTLKNKICPKCKKAFKCSIDDIKNCQCNLEISQDTRIFLSKTKYDCLCENCLQNYDKLVSDSKIYSFPNSSNLIEGLHYYKENSYLVFTEMYHLLKGKCCKNNCRHCVYGFKGS